MQLYGFADPNSSLAVELFTTSTASSIKTKKDCNRLRELLIAKKIPFAEVCLFFSLSGFHLPQLEQRYKQSYSSHCLLQKIMRTNVRVGL